MKRQQQKRKMFRFPKGVNTVLIPFRLSEWQSWQSQVLEREICFHKEYYLARNHRLGFSITNHGAELIVTR